jgi:DNA mismatch repair ATPase MutS
MKAHLLHRNQDIDWTWVLKTAATREAARTGRRYDEANFDPRPGLPWNERALTADLALQTLFEAMAQDDDYILQTARKVVLAGVTNDLETILYRQAVLRDCLKAPGVVRDLYAVAVEAMQKQKGHYLGILSHYPDWVLRDSIEQLETLLESLRKLRRIADSHARQFASEGWTVFFAMLKRDLDDDYLAVVKHHLERLKFRSGLMLLSAELGSANKGNRYVLHQASEDRSWTWWNWFRRLFASKSPIHSFELHSRDEAGAQALRTIRNRGLAPVADALGQSADHVRNFFRMLRVELAFYVGCINLHERLRRKNEPVCMPVPAPDDQRRLAFRGLYDVGLALTVDRRVVGNEANADGKHLVVVTGANTGGKSTFLRSVGLAQLMMQSGMFVPAESFHSSICDGLFTHYKREEDAGMESGKFDEELRRMSEIVDHVVPRSMVLFNESFAATNEREGSEIARQIMTALLDKTVRVICVTHLYELAHGLYETNRQTALFLRAERQRTFKMVEGEPLPTSFGQDLYDSIFVADGAGTGTPKAAAGAR